MFCDNNNKKKNQICVFKKNQSYFYMCKKNEKDFLRRGFHS